MTHDRCCLIKYFTHRRSESRVGCKCDVKSVDFTKFLKSIIEINLALCYFCFLRVFLHFLSTCLFVWNYVSACKSVVYLLVLVFSNHSYFIFLLRKAAVRSVSLVRPVMPIAMLYSLLWNKIKKKRRDALQDNYPVLRRRLHAVY